MTPLSHLPRRTTASGFILFGLIGAVQALYGPLIPSLRASFHVGTAAAGLVLSAYFVGAVGGTVLSGLMRGRIPLHWRLTGASLLLCLGCAGTVKAGVWVAVLAATVVTGLGNGVLIVAFNTVFASGFGDRSPAMVSLLNAAFGCGAVAGPLALGVVLGTHFRALFLLEALCTLCLIPALLSTPDDRRSRASSDPGDPPPPLHLLVTFIAFFLVYEGVEANLGGWEATQLTARGLSTSAAANATAVFWAALTAGRIVLAPLSAWVPLERILVAALTILTLLMLLAHVQGLTVVAYTLAGFAISLVFPLAFVWLDRTFPRNMSAPSLCLVGALLGGIIFPLGVGKWIAASTPEVLPTALTIFAVLSLLTALSLQWRLAPPRAYVGRRIPG